MKKYDSGVSNIVGFVIIFGITTIIFTATILSFSIFIDNKKTEVGRDVALDVANRIADSLVDAVTTIRSLSDTNYTKCVDIPDKIMGKDYYIELTTDRIYVNSTDGRISVNTTTFNAEDLGIFMDGKVYGSSGKAYIQSNKTSSVFKIDFGTPSRYELGNADDDHSPVEPGYLRVSNLTQIKTWSGTGSWPGWNETGGDSVDVYFVYHVPIVITHQPPPSFISQGETYETLSNYPVQVVIPGWFPYDLVNKTSSGEPKIVFWEPDMFSYTGTINDSEIRPFYIEEWNDYPGGGYTSTVWVNVSLIPDTTNNPKVIYLLFCGIENKTGERINDSRYNQIVSPYKRVATNVFEAFEEFDIASFGRGNKEGGGLSWAVSQPNCSFYKIYSSGGVETFIRLYSPSMLIAGNVEGVTSPVFSPVMDEPSSDFPDPESGNYTQNSSVYVLEARVRYHNGSDSKNNVDGDVLVNVNLTSESVSELYVGGFKDTTRVYVENNEKPIIMEINTVNAVMMNESLSDPFLVNSKVSSNEDFSSAGIPLWSITADNGRSVICSSYQCFCRYNVSTGGWEWVPASQIDVDDQLYTVDITTGELQLSSVTDSSSYLAGGVSTLYHLRTSEGNFFAEGFLVQSYYMVYSNSLDGTHYFLAGIPEYDTTPETVNSPTEFCLYRHNQSDERIGTNYTNQLLSQPNIDNDQWYVAYLNIGNSRVKDYRDGVVMYLWNYSTFYAFLFKSYSGGILTTATPMGIDTSEDAENLSDPRGGPFFGGNIGLGCGLLSSFLGGGSSLDVSSYMDVDWIRVRKSAAHPPSASVMCMESYYIGWWNTTGIDAVYDNSTHSFLLCDFNNCTEKRDFGMYLFGGGNYTVTVSMGDPNASVDHGSMYVYYQVDDGEYVYGLGPVDLSSGGFVTRGFKVSIPEDDSWHILNITFSRTQLDSNGNPVGTVPPSGGSWVVNALTVEKGFKGVRLRGGV